MGTPYVGPRGAKYPNCNKKDCPIWGPIHEHDPDEKTLWMITTQDRVTHIIDKETDVYLCYYTKSKENSMPRKKKDSTEPKLVGNGHTTINQVVEASVSEMLTLNKIITPDTSVQTIPDIKKEPFAVRADAIDLVESDKYVSSYSFNQYEADCQREDRSRRRYDFFRESEWWNPVTFSDCAKITLAGGAEYLVEGTMDGILAMINEAS